MRRLALQGTFDAYATDHCAFTRADKDAERSDYARVPNGLAGIGALVPLVHELHSDLSALAKHLALNPAKIAGLYPRKGTIKKGSDADLAIIDLAGEERPVRSSLADVHETYPGRTTRLGASCSGEERSFRMVSRQTGNGSRGNAYERETEGLAQRCRGQGHRTGQIHR
jgi:dihydropyrimidinase